MTSRSPSAASVEAWGFAALFVVHGLLFIEAGVLRDRLAFGSPRGWTGWLGWALVAYASIGYPLLSQLIGHGYPAMPMFGTRLARDDLHLRAVSADHRAGPTAPAGEPRSSGL
jgi:hypothetical protein